MNRTSCRKADRLWGHDVGLREARVGLGTGQCQGETPYQFLRLTIACKRPPIASARASLRLSAAPEAWRWARENQWLEPGSDSTIGHKVCAPWP
jgi:hypothetical protein